MATPYHFTPRIPVPPHPTPLSATAYISKAKRPPIHNPYDKFTQPEFDVWIGDITGALKRALGQIEADDDSNSLERTQEVSTGNATAGYRPIDLDESEDEVVNDSFAEIKARRALGKGKARDPREGPGLGGADRAKPIEIVSSDEEEEHEVELAMGVDDGEEEEEEEEDEEEEEEEDYIEQEEDYSWKRGQSSSQPIFSPAKRRKYIQAEGSEGDDFEEVSEEDDEEDLSIRKYRPTEVIDIVSDDEAEMDDDRQGFGEEGEERGAEELVDGFEEEYSEEEEHVRLGTSHLKFHAARISNSRDSRHFHYADEETRDEAEVIEDDDEIEEIQPPQANTAFPPQVHRSPARVDRHIEIPDPWAGPRIYTEDNYRGGDVRSSPGTRRDPHYLGDNDGYETEEVVSDVTNHKVDVDAMQIGEQDTSFPPRREEQERPVDIHDPWIDPRTYAEDFCAGGEVRTHPSHLESTVQGDIEVPSTSKMVAPDEQGYEENPIEDEEQFEDELEHDEEAVIQPPTQQTFTPASRLALPIPASAEFISIDDSDEEIGSAQEPIKLGALEVVEVDFHELQHEDVDERSTERERSLEANEIVREDITYMHQPLDSTPPSEVDTSIATWPLPGSPDQQNDISMNQYQSLYADIEAVTVQTEEQSEVISTLVDWNYPPAFPTGIPTSAPGHLATPSEESNADIEESAMLDTEVVSPEPVDKESPPHPLVHEEVTTQAEELDKILVENTETLIDQVILSVPEPAFGDSESQLTFKTLIVDPSSSHTSPDDLVDDKRITEHDEGVMAGEVEQVHDVEITLADIPQLVDEDSTKKLVPPQQSSADIVDDEFGSRDISMKTEIHMVSVALNSHVAPANAEDDIPPSAEGIDDQMVNETQPSASASSLQIPVPVYHPHTYDYDQLPTPPPDQTPTQSPSVANDGPCSPISPPRTHKVEEVQDEHDQPQLFLVDSTEPDVQIGIEPAAELGYTVVEAEPDDEYVDEDADGEIEFEIKDVWYEIQSTTGEMQLPRTDYIVEEPLTDGRLTEEPGDRAQSPGVASVEPKESQAHHMNSEITANQDVPFSIDEELIPLDSEASSQVEMNIQPQTSSNLALEELIGGSEPPTHSTPDSVSSPEYKVPMPVTADANVMDSTSCPDMPSYPSVIPEALDVQPQTQRQALGDGLFTPACESTSVTPTSPPGNVHSRPLDELAQSLVFGSRSSGNIHATTLRDGPASVLSSPPFREPVSMHVTLTRKPTDPILVSDPYPYSLSTPDISLMDPTEEDTERDYSMSSNSTLEKDPVDKDIFSILDVDELELQYPPEPDILAELNVFATAKGEDASKFVNQVADLDADGDFDPDFVANRLPQLSAEIQPVADLPKLITSVNTIAPGPSNGVEKNGLREILPIDGITSSDLPQTETTNHDPSESPTTPPNEITGTSARTTKRKRETLRPPFEKAATTTTEKGKSKKVPKLAGVGKGKAKATNQEIDQLTSEATIHVKPRWKTQSVESVANQALSRNPSETKASGRSSSSAGTTCRMLRQSSRSSSVASSVPSDQSATVVALPSPTIHKPNVPLVQNSQPISLFHAHGMKRDNQNNQNNQFQSSQARTLPTQPSRPSIQRVISLPRISNFGSADISPTTATVVTSPTLGTSPANMKAVPIPAVRHALAIPSSSPITRSHCRYRRISLPKEEGGLRVCFLVPGCSLSDRELMAQEEIEDHGDATHEDSLRMIKDIESLDFSSYLIGILRQLVGLDILREQEVFYLPQPGEEVVRKTSPRKERSALFRRADSASHAGSPGYSGSIRSPASMKAPTSVADSTSTSLSAFRRRLDSEKGSTSAFSDTELEHSDGELPHPKRAKPSPDEQGDTSPMGPPLKAQGKRQLRSRSKQIGMEYQPEAEHEGDSANAESSNRRNKPSKQGVKRRRDSEVPAKDDSDERILKKVKMRLSVPMSQTLATGESKT